LVNQLNVLLPIFDKYFLKNLVLNKKAIIFGRPIEIISKNIQQQIDYQYK